MIWRRLRPLVPALVAITFVLPAAARLLPAPQAETPEAIRALMIAELDPVRKVRHLSRLADLEFGTMRRQTAAGKFDEALKTVERYRDDVKTIHSGFKSSGRNAEKKPAGFKQLQIHLRRALRDFGITILTLPQDMKQFFVPVQAELEAMDKELIDALFPRNPGRKNEKEKPKPEEDSERKAGS